MTGQPTDELVVLVDEDGNAVGSAPKATTHHTQTPLHLAFSCYVFDAAGRLLVTQRALDKATFPGVWTNSFCGHPAPGEDLVEAVVRRAEHELGLALASLELVLPAFRYEATGPNGVRENELCPVFTATTASEPVAAAAEVAAATWVPWAQFRDEVLAGAREVSVWCALQVAALAAREGPDGQFASAALEELPPAARPARTATEAAGVAPPARGYRAGVTQTPHEPIGPDDDQEWPTHCEHCGTELQSAVVDVVPDADSEHLQTGSPGTVIAQDYCPNPECPAKSA